jgi:hypothetical protein
VSFSVDRFKWIDVQSKIPGNEKNGHALELLVNWQIWQDLLWKLRN